MQSVETPIAPEKMPRHVAIIMDGNGRWAKERGLPRSMGHRQGVLALRPVIEQSIRWGVPYLTLFAFSTENWARPKEEVGALMGLIEEFFYREVEELRSQGVRIRILGELSALPERPRRLVERAVELTEPNRRLTLSLALNYGGRAELARAARLLAQEAAEGKLRAEDIDEAALAKRLYTAELPDVDLLIRTAGELRISNFLLFQSAYAEFVVLPCRWPDFDEQQYAQALRQYGARQRRFGGLEARERQ